MDLVFLKTNQSPCFCFNFVVLKALLIVLKALLIVLILILTLIYFILIELRLFE